MTLPNPRAPSHNGTETDAQRHWFGADGILVEPGPPSRYERQVKWPLDRLIAALLLIVLLPILVIVTLGVLVAMGRPVLYSQRRVGRLGAPFVMYKFRSMRPAPSQAVTHAPADDPRHTPFGRFLRATSLDELPQLWNVLRGEMSLVGPRPEIVEVAVEHGLLDHPRHHVRPGITGLWQVSEYRIRDHAHQHVDIDVRYVRDLSFQQDVAIAFRTIPSIVGPAVAHLRRRTGQPQAD